MQRQYRLGQNRQFAYVYRKGVRVSSKDLTLLYVRNARRKVGFSVSKKVGVAVVRNRTKRRLRECFRPRMPGLRGGLYVVVARPSAAERTYRELAQEVDGLLRRLESQLSQGRRP